MKNTEILNDLIRINEDRIEGYNKAAEESKEENLRLLFTDMARQSQHMVIELRKHVKIEGKDPAEGATFKGKIYRAWMEIKAAFGDKDPISLLNSCEFGEDAAQKAYQSSLDEADLSIDVRNVIQQQKMELKKSHDKIKSMKDAAQVA